MEHIGKNSSRVKLAEQAASSAHHAIDQLSEVARPAVWRATATAHQMVDRIGDTTDRAAERLEHAAARLNDARQHLVGVSSGYVRDHPLRTLGIALAAGFLVSRLTSSRRPAPSGESADEAPAAAGQRRR